MGLDWCLKDKELDNGETLSPLEALGARRLDADDPVAVAAFREVYESHRKVLETVRGGLGVNPGYAAHWGRPFEVVLAEMAADRVVLVNTVPKGNEWLVNDGPFSGLTGAAAFRGKRVGRNRLLTEELQVRAYHDMEPGEMLDYAQELERYMDAEVVAVGREKARRFDEISTMFGTEATEGCEEEWETLKEELQEMRFWDFEALCDAVRWLRFWGERGFSMHAWF